ncbi:MAG: cyclic nucleotide-binding domain-containing protein [Methylococcaceae bacterium]|jgi:CRP/FNR family cyclic AMP-dependent transcriptional regulator|nr:cyclic nucleotide-binding domain-containing protein [Methylococcaceae bacterium]
MTKTSQRDIILRDSIENIIKDPKILKDLAWKYRHFHANEIIAHKDEIGRSFFFIEEGMLRVTVHVELEERRNIQAGISDLEKGDFFGEISLFESRIRTASVTAITDGRLLEFDGKLLSAYLDKYPDRGYLFFKKLFETLIIRETSGIHRVESLLAWGLKAHGISKHL